MASQTFPQEKSRKSSFWGNIKGRNWPQAERWSDGGAGDSGQDLAAGGRLAYAIRLPVSARPTTRDLCPQPPLHGVATRASLLAPHLIDYCRQGGQMDLTHVLYFHVLPIHVFCSHIFCFHRFTVPSVPFTPYLYSPSAPPFPLPLLSEWAWRKQKAYGPPGAKVSIPIHTTKKNASFRLCSTGGARPLSQATPPRSDKRGKLFAHISGSSGIWGGRIQEGGFLMINASINHSKYRMSHISSGKRMEIGKKVVNLWEI
mgnify:CR=1 FL=1